ncbi:unnamed protein product, partial [Medioppia subpectinata]
AQVVTLTTTTTTTTTTTSPQTPSPTPPPALPTLPPILSLTTPRPPLPPHTQSLITTPPLMTSINSEILTDTTSAKPIHKCLNIALMAKVMFRYNTTDSIVQQVEYSSKQLYQPSKCNQAQSIIIYYDMIDHTFVRINLNINESDIEMKSIHFEYPFVRLVDYYKSESEEQMKICSPTQTTADTADVYKYSNDKCLTADTNQLTNYSLKYTLNEQIFCKSLPIITLQTHNTYEVIEISITDLNVVYTDIGTPISPNTGQCPLIGDIDGNPNSEPPISLATSTQVWIGVGYAIVGAIVIFARLTARGNHSVCERTALSTRANASNNFVLCTGNFFKLRYDTLCISIGLTGSGQLTAGSLPPLPSVGGTILPTPWQPWFVREQGKDVVCILAKFGAEFFIEDAITRTQSTYTVNPLTAKVGSTDSRCGSDSQVLHLVFDSKGLWLTFNKDNDKIYVNNITFKYDKEMVTNTTRMFESPKKFGYKCFNEQKGLVLSERVTMNIMNVRLEAFRNYSGNYFVNDSETEPEWERVGLKCGLDRDVSDAYMITGISVGCGIFVLVSITLVAIWSGRHQERIMYKIKMMKKLSLDGSRNNSCYPGALILITLFKS